VGNRRECTGGDEAGSITLEAAITLPLLLFICFVLSWLLMLYSTEAALQDAVDEAVKTAAVHTYPLELLAHVYRNNAFVQELEQRLERVLPYSVRALWNERKQRSLPAGGEQGGREWQDGAVHERWVRPMVMQFADRGRHGKPLLKESRLTVTRVVLPTFGSEETSYFGIVAVYRVPIPFFGMDMVLTASAMERCWVGDK
jgi:hypothetical protein